MAKINIDDSIKSMLLKLSEGNPGALRVCIEILQNGSEIDQDNIMGGVGVLLSLDDIGLYGPQIWMLYKDVCREDLPTMLAVLRGVQLGFVAADTLKTAVESYGAGIDVPDICRQVTTQLPRFKVQMAV